MLISTQDNIANYKVVKTFGLVKGNAVRSRNIVRNLMGNLKTIVGGEVAEWTKALAETREQALDRLINQAKDMGANGIVCLRFVTSEMEPSASEILAYGTAVQLELVSTT